MTLRYISRLCNRELKQQRSWAKHVNRKWAFFSLICLDATKFVWLTVFTLIEMISPNVCSKSELKCAKSHFQLTCMAQKRRCLNSVMIHICIKLFTPAFSALTRARLTKANVCTVTLWRYRFCIDFVSGNIRTLGKTKLTFSIGIWH